MDQAMEEELAVQAMEPRDSHWRRLVTSCCRNASEGMVDDVTAALVEAEAAGQPSSVLHEAHLWQLANVQLPGCPHCGGPADPRLGYHNLCAERARHGLPLHRLDVRGPCPCGQCRAVSSDSR